MKIKETTLFSNDKYKVIFRQADDKEALDIGYKPHTILLIQEGENKVWFNIKYNDNDFTIEKADWLKWYLPKYLIDELKDSIEIYHGALE